MHAALSTVAAENSFLIVPGSDLSRAVMLDDLCNVSALWERAGVSDASLACAAAEAAPALATLASMVYAARSVAFKPGTNRELAVATGNGGAVNAKRAATEGAAANGAATTGKTANCISPALAAQTVYFPSLADALAQARAWGARIVTAPRGLVTRLENAADSMENALVRMLRAAYCDEAADLIRALSAQPYCVHPLELGRAMEADSHGRRSVDLKLLANRLKASPSREAVFAALRALEAARALRQAKRFALKRAIDALAQGLADWCGAGSFSKYATAIENLGAMAEKVDAVWASAAHAPPAKMRVQLFTDGLLACTLDGGLTLFPRGCLEPGVSDVELKFLENGAAPAAVGVLAGVFSDALTCPKESSPQAATPHATELLTPSQRVIQITAGLDRALATHFLNGEATRQWTAPVPEHPTAVIASGMTFSASRLNSYVKCSRRWFYEYLCAAIEEPTSMQAAYGRVLHAALEALHREIRVPGERSAADMLQRLLFELDVAFGRSRADFASQLEYEVCRQRARRCAEQYVRWLELESKRAPMEIIHVELSHRFSRGGHQFVGYIDRIDRSPQGGPVTIFDYKTGRIDDDPQAYLAKVRSGEEAQLALYYAMRTDGGDDVGRIALVSLRDPRDDVWILALDVVPDAGDQQTQAEPLNGVMRATCSQADLEASLEALLQRCDLLSKVGLEHFAAGDNPPCAFCAYNLACRERPFQGERIFAR